MTLKIAAALVALASSIAASAETPDAPRPLIRTLPLPADMAVMGGTYTPSGKVLVDFRLPGSTDPRDLGLAIVNDDGTGLRILFSGKIPQRPKDNGLRQMIFPDNKRIFLGDFVLECTTSLDVCTDPKLLPVRFPAEVADGAHVEHRWSEIIVAPDNRHVAWTTLLTNYAAAVFVAEMRREGDGYVLAKPRLVSTVDAFKPDPAHPGAVLPQPMRNGEVKQFVHGGTAISVAGAVRRDMPDSVVQNLLTGEVEPITDTPGYTETTIFSPDERLGVVMTTRFSPADPAILGLIPRPYPAALNIGMNMFAYTYAVTGVRRSRPGNIGPALIDIAASKQGNGYLGVNLNTSPDWVYYSPISWHPGSRKAMWPEGLRGSSTRRLQIVEVRDERLATPVAARPFPRRIPDARTDLSIVPALVGKSQQIDVKVHGRASGYLTYRRNGGEIDKVYFDFSDDGQAIYSGQETLRANPRGQSVYTADVRVSGAKRGEMKLKLTFGPLGGQRPARILFERDDAGVPLSHGYAEYDGKRLTVDSLMP